MKLLNRTLSTLATLSMVLFTPASLAGPRDIDLPGGSVSRPHLPPTRQITTPRYENRGPMLRTGYEFVDRASGTRAILRSASPHPVHGVEVFGQAGNSEVLTDFRLFLPRNSNPIRPNNNHAEAVDDYMANGDNWTGRDFDPFQVRIENMTESGVILRSENDIVRRGEVETTYGGQFRLDLSNARTGGTQPGALVRNSFSLVRRGPDGSAVLTGFRSADGRSLAVNLGEYGAGSPQQLRNIELPENAGEIVDFEMDVITASQARTDGLITNTGHPIVRVEIQTADRRTLTYHYEVDPTYRDTGPDGLSYETNHIRNEWGPQMGRWSNDVEVRLGVTFEDPISVRQAQTIEPGAGPEGMGALFDPSAGTN